MKASDKNIWLLIVLIVVLAAVGYAAFQYSHVNEEDETALQNTDSSVSISGDTRITLGYQGAGAEEISNSYLSNKANREVIATGLDVPRSMIPRKADHMIITERGGRIMDINLQNGEKRVLKTLPAEQSKGTAEAGLLGIALQNNTLYTAYSYKIDGRYRNRLVSIPLVNDTAGEETILIDDVPGSNNHDGGAVKIGPDGKIYRTLGDVNDRPSAQDRGGFNGKILRVNTDGSVPDDNPIENSYLRSYGHRNPQGLAWQPGTNQLWSTEHGPSSSSECCRDEINMIVSGQNYGWPDIMGDETKDGMLQPIWISGDDETRAPAGIAFIRSGSRQGNLLIAGLRGQAIYRVIFDENNPSQITKVESHAANIFGRIRDVFQGDDGYLYMITNNTDGRQNNASLKADDDDKLWRIELE